MQTKHLTSELAERYWSKVDIRTGDECWPWTGGKSGNGYGAFNPKRGEFWIATHASLHLSGRPRPPAPNDKALHACANPICVNPAHLRWGSNTENMADMVRHGHAQNGERSNTCVLTESQVRLVRDSDLSLTALAKMYGVQKAAIYKIKKRMTWRHLP